MMPKRTDSLPWREIDGLAVVVQPRKGEVHELNAVASFLWKRADGTASLEALAGSLSEEFDITPEEALADAREFFDGLAAKGLVQDHVQNPA